jgi:hypothetical protein
MIQIEGVEDKVRGSIYRRKKGQVKGERRKLRSKALRNLYPSPDVIEGII